MILRHDMEMISYVLAINILERFAIIGPSWPQTPAILGTNTHHKKVDISKNTLYTSAKHPV